MKEQTNEEKYANKIFSLVQHVQEAQKQLKEKFNIDSEIKDCNTLAVDTAGQLNEAQTANVINTIYSICPKDMVEVEWN